MGKIGVNSTSEKINYDICINQAEIFELASLHGYDMKIFTEQYMNSNFCNKSYDKVWSLYHNTHKEECLYEIETELDHLLRKRQDEKIFNHDVAWWIGFTYRQLCIETGLSSMEIIKTVSFDELCIAYPGLHTIDKEYATDIICEKHNLRKISDEVERINNSIDSSSSSSLDYSPKKPGE